MSQVQLICFKAGEETYAVDIMRVREIILYRKITPVPRSPEFLEGIVHIRGKVIPVVDLRKKFLIEQGDITPSTRIIVVNLNGKDVGFTVDHVMEVLRIDSKEIARAPAVAKGIDSEYLIGVIQDDWDELILILDMDSVLSSDEQVRLQQLVGEDDNSSLGNDSNENDNRSVEV